MTKPAGEIFSSRWALILAGLGMAVGTGNLWRFPRIAAQNGGAAFLIPWLIFGSPKVRVGHFGQVYKCDDRPGCVWVHHRPQGSMRVRVGFLGREHVPGARPVEADGAVDA